jgi:hypothetical protein
LIRARGIKYGYPKAGPRVSDFFEFSRLGVRITAGRNDRKPPGCSFKKQRLIVDVKNLKDEGARDFSAVVIINRALAGRPDPRVESYIDYEPQKNKIILLTTGILDAWKPDTEGVDAMTLASVIKKWLR